MTIHLPPVLLGPMRSTVLATIRTRPADRVIGSEADPYLLRWYLTPRGGLGNAYAHEFRRSDDDRALHDHPWESCSIILAGRYVEHTIDAGGLNRRVLRSEGDVVFRGAEAAHRVELIDRDREAGAFPVTLFLTGETVRYDMATGRVNGGGDGQRVSLRILPKTATAD